MRSFLIIALALASGQLVVGHAYVWGISVNGKDQGRGDAVPGYVRKIVNNDPIKDVRSPDMTCNKNQGPNSKVIDAQSGDKVRPILIMIKKESLANSTAVHNIIQGLNSDTNAATSRSQSRGLTVSVAMK